ncbi:MAG: WYL domain-containing protein [Bacillota bacterium]|jgi:proteasome accessory factor B|uniref:WYL domain-containing protein n=1 Tax=Desulforudis sp. DRI-14 TaxID=3459793 RepID=UPI00347E0EBD
MKRNKAQELIAIVSERPGIGVDELTDRLDIEPGDLYTLLNELAGDERIFDGRHFRVSGWDGPLTLARVRELAAPQVDLTRSLRINKIIELLNEATPTGGLTVKDLAEACEVSERQVYRDLKAIEEQVGIELERRGKTQTLYRLKRCYLPPLSPDRALIIYLTLLQQQGSPLAGQTEGLKRLLVTHLFKNRYPVEAFPFEKLQQRVHIVDEGLADPAEVGGVFTRLLQALTEERRIKIRYYVAYRNAWSDRIVEPYGLVCKRHNWYLAGFCQESGRTRTFRVDQIKNVFVLGEGFSYPPDFNLRAFLGDSWGVINDGEPFDIRLRFSPVVAHRVRRIVYHPSQCIEEELPDGSVVVAYRSSGKNELKGWLLQWGPEVEVLEPQWLRDELKETALTVAKMYNI